MKYLLRFGDPLAARIEHSGGKGANLATLTQRGFPVPPGFIVTAQAYRDFIHSARDIVRRADHLAFDDPQRLREQSQGLIKALADLPLPEVLRWDVRTLLREYDQQQAFSVRSSSTMEDLAGAAFAGQHETFLNRVGEEDILLGIHACFLSLWADRAIAYRRQKGFDHALAAMAVVVQEMIPCEVAGVGFSMNPVTGDLNSMLVNSNFGLGESVVSGEGEVDQFDLDKSTRQMRSSHIARKTRMVVCKDRHTAEVVLEGEQSSRPSLTIEQLSECADLLVRIERSYRFPQDVEWGFARGKLHLLQSRPITTFPPRWTRDESAERFPHVITPLTWDFFQRGFQSSVEYSFELMGLPPYQGKWFETFNHYVYGNQTAVDLYLRRPPIFAGSLDEVRAAIPRWREEFRWVQELPVTWSRDLDNYLLGIGRAQAQPLEGLSLTELWGFALSIVRQGANYFRPNIAISITHTTLFRLVHGLLRMIVPTEEANRLHDALFAFCETKTCLVNRELFELARIIRAHPEQEKAFLENATPRLAAGPFPGLPVEFNQRFEQFLLNHGHRELDFDYYHPTWREAPWVPLDNIKMLLRTPLDTPPAQRERELRVRAQQAELEIMAKAPSDLHFFFHEIIRLARAYVSLDDLEHYHTTRLAWPVRRTMSALGQRLVSRGVMAEPLDIFFAHLDQITEAIHRDDSAAWQQFSTQVADEKAAYLRDKDRRPEWILGGESAVEETSGETSSGLAGSPGTAEGPVFIVQSEADFANFPKGAVLVARTTNPTWTPLFYGAAAVITESGGPLSHGAVTAREMGLPAVMSVRDCLDRLKNGQRVRVDGTKGKVHLGR